MATYTPTQWASGDVVTASNLNKIENQLKVLTNAQTTLDNTLSQQQSTISDLNSDVELLSGQGSITTELNNDITDLATRTTALETQYTTLNTSYGTLSQTVNTLINNGEGNNNTPIVVNNNVDDVKINNISILENKIANIPLASTDNLGVVKYADGYGVTSTGNDGIIAISCARSTDIQEGISGYKPITPNRQFVSTFYGLAAAAGDTSQALSNNEVGEYTQEAQLAIKEMLGITNWATINNLTLSEAVDKIEIDLTSDYNEVFVLINTAISNRTASLVIKALNNTKQVLMSHLATDQITDTNKKVSVRLQNIGNNCIVKQVVQTNTILQDVSTTVGSSKMRYINISSNESNVLLPVGTSILVFAR